MGDNDRPQDVDRSHERKRPNGADPLLARYQRVMRDELSDLLSSLDPVPQDQGLGMVPIPPKRPPLSERTKIWDLAIKLGKELGSAIDPPTPTDPTTARSARPPARRVKYG